MRNQFVGNQTSGYQASGFSGKQDDGRNATHVQNHFSEIQTSKCNSRDNNGSNSIWTEAAEFIPQANMPLN